mgnify:CR=1 FL=1
MVTKLDRDGTLFYLHNAWAESPDGQTGFTLTEPEAPAYIGNCISMTSGEIKNPESYNWIATEFQAVEESDTAELMELGETIPEDPEDEDDDYSYEDYMDGAVQAAADTATTAQESAEVAQEQAEAATASAELAQQKAEEATASAEEAKTAAGEAKTAAETATADAATAKEKAETATADAETAKAKAEEATKNAATAQEQAEKATASAGEAKTAADTAGSEAKSATESARTAGIAAATAQAAAEAAQGDIDEQQKYFYHDKLGAHVLDASNGGIRTDIKADGMHVVDTSTEKDICSYTKDGAVIGGASGKNIELSNRGVTIKDGTIETLKIESTQSVEEGTREEFKWDCDSAWTNAISKGEVYTETFTLKKDPAKISDVIAYQPNWDADGDGAPFSYNSGGCKYSISGKRLTITIDGSDPTVQKYKWNKYNASPIMVWYTPLSKAESTIYCDNLNVSGTIYTKRDPNSGYKVPPIVDLIYPVGSIYQSVNPTSPAELFGGNWRQIKDCFLLACGDKYDVEKYGGSEDAIVVEHDHTQKAHHHNANGNGFCSYLLGESGITRTRVKVDSSGRFTHLGVASKTTADSSGLRFNSVTNDVTPTINRTGSSGKGANMPPYYTVYTWIRDV